MPDPKSRTGLILALAKTDTTCLAAIDPYGMTIFNRIQIPHLIRELEKARETITEQKLADHSNRELAQAREMKEPPGLIAVLEDYIRLRSHKDLVAHIDGILKLAHEALTEPHQYVRFVGD